MIGNVTAVAGAHVTVYLKAQGIREGRGEGSSPSLNVGSILKIPTAESVVFAIVGAIAAERHDGPSEAVGGYLCEAELMGEVGFGDAAFQRGVSLYPSLGAPVHWATSEDVALIYDCGSEPKVRIGSLLQDRQLGAHVMIDLMLSRHFAILGNTGSGKSTAVALLLRAILQQNGNGHVVLLDPHAEYNVALSDLAEVIDLTSLKIPCWMLNFEEMGAIMVPPGETQERDTQFSILKDAIVEAKLNYRGPGQDTSYITVDTPVPYRIGDLPKLIERAMARPNRPSGVGPYLRLIERLNHLERDRRYEFLFAGFQIRDELPNLMSRILKVPVSGRPLTILDLSGVPSEIVDVVVSLLCRIIFDFVLWSDHAKSPPVLVVCEEAHRYVPENVGEGFSATRRSIARIAKEGRKYGVALGLVSQRPSEVDAGILSQCGILFAFRLSNEKDKAFVVDALPENARGLAAELPALRRQEAIVVGEGVPVAMRMRFDDVGEDLRPHLISATFSSAWQSDDLDQAFIDETIEHWRTQRRHRSRRE
jgi:hypothetical protein